MKKILLFILDLSLLAFLLASVAIFFTGGFQFYLGPVNVRMTSFRNIFSALVFISILKFIFDKNWICSLTQDGLRIKINSLFSQFKLLAKRNKNAPKTN